MVRGEPETAGENHCDCTRRVFHELFSDLGQGACLASLNPVQTSLVPRLAFAELRLVGCLGTEGPLSNYYGMQGHMNRTRFTRCAWSAVFMLVASVGAIFGTISYLAK